MYQKPEREINSTSVCTTVEDDGVDRMIENENFFSSH